MCTANSYFNPDISRYQHTINLTWLPPPLLPFSLLVAPANIMVSLPLQLMKATMLAAESFLFFFQNYEDIYRHESGRCRTLLPFVIYFFIISSFQVFLLYRKVLSIISLTLSLIGLTNVNDKLEFLNFQFTTLLPAKFEFNKYNKGENVQD